jgi:surface polysaccharide O-acyltransferase-like enzyme
METTTIISAAADKTRIQTMAPADREYGLDWLRVFAFCILIFYHSGMAFVSWDWHLKNPEKSATLEFFMLLVNRWRLPLLFFISGAGVFFSLRRRTFAEFSIERLKRLLIPLLVGMFVIVPPQIYFERLSKGAQFTYAEFYPSVFQFTVYPAGSFSWHHLWFVAYILVYSLAGIPVFAFLRAAAGQRLVTAMVRMFKRWPPLVYLVNVPNLLVAELLGPHWPQTNNLISDWANLTGAFLTFLWGFIIASNMDFLGLITRRRREFMIAGLAFATLFFSAYYSGFTNGWPEAASRRFWTLVSSFYGMTWIFALIGYARARITQSGRRLKYATQAVYPFYIFHQTITVAIVYCVIPWSIGVWPKLAIVAAGTFAGSLLLFEVVRRLRILRPLFGLKASA